MPFMAGTVLAGLLTMHVIHTDIYRDGGIAILIVLLCAAYIALFVGLYAG